MVSYMYLSDIDRHTDPEYKLFANKDKAIAYAKDLAVSSCRHSEDYEEHTIEGRLFHADYSCESDCVYVQEIDVQ